MADAVITITIPEAKIPVVLAAVNFHVNRRNPETGEPDPLSAVEARDWLKQRFIRGLIHMARKAQESEYYNSFVFVDPGAE